MGVYDLILSAFGVRPRPSPYLFRSKSAEQLAGACFYAEADCFSVAMAVTLIFCAICFFFKWKQVREALAVVRRPIHNNRRPMLLLTIRNIKLFWEMVMLAVWFLLTAGVILGRKVLFTPWFWAHGIFMGGTIVIMLVRMCCSEWQGSFKAFRMLVRTGLYLIFIAHIWKIYAHVN